MATLMDAMRPANWRAPVDELHFLDCDRNCGGCLSTPGNCLGCFADLRECQCEEGRKVCGRYGFNVGTADEFWVSGCGRTLNQYGYGHDSTCAVPFPDTADWFALLVNESGRTEFAALRAADALAAVEEGRRVDYTRTAVWHAREALRLRAELRARGIRERMRRGADGVTVVAADYSLPLCYEA